MSDIRGLNPNIKDYDAINFIINLKFNADKDSHCDNPKII